MSPRVLILNRDMTRTRCYLLDNHEAITDSFKQRSVHMYVVESYRRTMLGVAVKNIGFHWMLGIKLDKYDN